ncbi:hypothetical protein [Actinoplanes sp. URMC 104]|uniref:hypothetical protein n=1 Tax=Actinoplanes sp. URMC 104 TaxID=3423409 RepID=UPI003F1E388F
MPTPTTVAIAAGWLAEEPPLPDRCVKHGEPAVRRATFAVRSHPRTSSRKRAFQPGYTSLNRAEEYACQVKLVKVSGWPLCRSCVRRRTIASTLAGVLFFGGVLAMIAGLVAGAVDDGPNHLPLVPILLGLAAVLLSPLPLRRAGLPRLARAAATADGSAVQVTDVSPAFTAQLPARGLA